MKPSIKIGKPLLYRTHARSLRSHGRCGRIIASRYHRLWRPACIPPGQNPSLSTVAPETAAEKPVTSASFSATMARYRPDGRGVWRGRSWTRPPPTRRAGVPRWRACPCWSRPLRRTWRPIPTGPSCTNEIDRYRFKRCLGDWQMRPLDAITRRDVEGHLNRLTGESGWPMANPVDIAPAFDLSPILCRFRGAAQSG